MLEILYEDNHIIVVVKKPNVPVQEDESKDEDLLTIIKKYLKEKIYQMLNLELYSSGFNPILISNYQSEICITYKHTCELLNKQLLL